MVRRADSGGDREAPIHSGLDSALGSHPCHILLAGPSIVRQVAEPDKRKTSILAKNSAKSRGVGGAAPPIMTMTFSLLTGVEQRFIETILSMRFQRGLRCSNILNRGTRGSASMRRWFSALDRKS